MEAPRERMSNSEWAERGERLRRLLAYSKHYQDDYATSEILDICRPIVRKMVSTLPGHLQDEVTSHMATRAIAVAANSHTSKADNPLSYMYDALRNEFLRQLRRLDRKQLRTTELRDPTDLSRTVPGAQGQVEDALIRRALHQERLRVQQTGQVTDALIVMVVEIRYTLGCDVAEACRALDFTDEETKRVSQRIARQKNRRGSFLYRLAHDILGRPVGGTATEAADDSATPDA